MVGSINVDLAARFQKHYKQAESSPRQENETTVLSTSDKVEISDEAKAASLNTHANSQTKNTAQTLISHQRARIFSDVFLANFRAHGIKGAFDQAWAAMQAAYPQVIENQVPSTDTPEEPLEELLAEYENTGGTLRTEATDDGSETEAKRKLTAMKIARRISKGDNVPMQDHRFLAEFDPNLYKAAMKASMVADNKDPEKHDSLADELAAEESAKALRDSQRTELDTDNVAETEVASEVDALA